MLSSKIVVGSESLIPKSFSRLRREIASMVAEFNDIYSASVDE